MPYIIALVVVLLLAALVLSTRIVKQYERGVILRFGSLSATKGPGFKLLIPFVDRLTRVSLRIRTVVLEPQEVITRDNVTIKVDAVLYFKIVDPIKAVMNVEEYDQATMQIALTTLRSVLGQSELDEVLAHRDAINKKLREIIDEQTEEPWGVRVTIVEVKDVLLPESMQRAMAKQAESEREKRAKVIHAQGERDAAETLAEAAAIIDKQPAALQLRYLQTLIEIAGERTSTIIPLPIDIYGTMSNILGNNGNHKDKKEHSSVK